MTRKAPDNRMAVAAGAYLVVRRNDGFGDVFPLQPAQRYTLGRAPTSRIVLKDDLCSREHAEIYQVDDRWHLRDLDSLNGTRVNGQRLDSEWELTPNDEVFVGRTQLLFVEDMEQLPELPAKPLSNDGVSIKKRLGQTRFLTPLPPSRPQETPSHEDTQAPSQRHTLSRDLALLYRLAL